MSRPHAFPLIVAAMRAFEEAGDFKALLEADTDVTGALSPEEIDRAFDLDEQLRHVDAIYDRVFEASASGASARGADEGQREQPREVADADR
jgi:adenylosuccinate lyase